MAVEIKYIICHWTGGLLTPNGVDLLSYQLCIDGEGKRHSGLIAGTTSSTGGMNSITYNIAACGGLATSELTKVQMEAFYKAVAEKVKEYGLKIEDVYTHAEIGEMCTSGTISKLLTWNPWLYQNKGKIDLTVLPEMKGAAKETGDFIRNKVRWYLERL